MTRRISVELIGDSRSVERAFRRAGGAADTFGGRMKRAAKGLAIGAAALGGVAIGVGISSVKAAASFEKTMARVVGLAGQSQKQVKVWGDQLIALGPQLGKSPQELAEALYFVASSGVPAAQAISVVTAAAKASAAGLGETQVVADAVTSVMNAYGVSAMSAAHATDVLVAIVREGKGEADAFAPVIGNVAAFASRLKVKFEEVGAALAAMTQLGTDPATAATQLQAFFSQLLKPAPKAEKAIAKVHLSFDRLRETLGKKGLLATLKLIKGGFAGNTKALAQSFPNIRALRALLALTAEDGGKVEAIFNRLTGSSGSLGRAFDAVKKTSDFNFAQLSASLKALKIAFGQGLLPVVTKVSQALAKKLMNPAFVARVRALGLLIGTNLYAAFLAISGWFNANWGTIKGGLNVGSILARKLATNVGTITLALIAVGAAVKALQVRLLLLRAPILIPIALVLMNRGAIEGFVKKKLGRLYGGGTLDLTKPGALGELPTSLRKKVIKQLPPSQGAARHPGRARGGPVMPGVSYRVGERGPETFIPAMAGNIMANGGGITINGPLHFHGVQNVRQLIGEIQRISKSNAASRRGRYGGQNLALG